MVNLHKTYISRGRQPFEAVKGMNLDIHPGELVALLGPSGCGKTTTLRMIAGLEDITEGEIYIGEQLVNDLPSAKRNIGVGFESYALYPVLDVAQNLAYGLRARKVPTWREDVKELAERLDMIDMLQMRPGELSSGQKQRVALARALIRKPPVLLLDEPLSHLDASQRQHVRRELKKLQREFGHTTIIVTHDQLEALSLADRIAVMDAGIIQQFGTPDEIFDNPANKFVADFVGEPKMNFLAGKIEIRQGIVGAKLNDGQWIATASKQGTAGQLVSVGLRPQDTTAIPGRDLGQFNAKLRTFNELFEYGEATVELSQDKETLLVETLPGISVTIGGIVSIAIDKERVYLFDLETAKRLR